MLYAIKIGFMEFELDKQGEIEIMFDYCERKFGFKGEIWEEIKWNYDYEAMGVMLEAIGVDYEEFIE